MVSGEEEARSSDSGEGERGRAKHAVREWEVGAGSGARATGGGTTGVWTPSLHAYRVVKIRRFDFFLKKLTTYFIKNIYSKI
jgi:hypothetical protein